MIHLELFWSFFQIGLFSIGGGYAAMPLIQHQVVELHPWLTLEQFSDIITISQMTPGPIAINSATFVGLQLGGLPGALVATAGCVLPSCIIVLTLAYVYYRYRGLSMVQGVLAGLRPAVVAMIASAGVTLVNLSFFGADALIAELRKMNKELNIPYAIQNYGEGGVIAEQSIIDEKEFNEKLSEVAKNAIADACTGSNPRIPTQEEMEKLLTAVYYDKEIDF